MSMWKKLKMGYRKSLYGPKGKGGKNGNGLILEVGCDIKNWKILWKPNSPIRSSCLKKPLNFEMPSFFVMASRNLLL